MLAYIFFRCGQIPPNDVYPIFTAATIHIDNIRMNDKAIRDAARPRLEQCIEWLQVRKVFTTFLFHSNRRKHFPDTSQGLSGTWSKAQDYNKLLNAGALTMFTRFSA